MLAKKICSLLKSFAGGTLYLFDRVWLCSTGCDYQPHDLYHDYYPAYQSQIKTVIGGGELVIIRAAEGFEDKPQWGRRQLQEAGWTPNDLLIGISASGLTKFVHGQIEYVIEKGAYYKPILLCCNPLKEVTQRFSNDQKSCFSTA